MSAAGKQRGDADDRWLWPEVLRAIGALRPAQVLIENVRNLVSWDKGRLWVGILDDLGHAGYAVRWLTLGACHVGAAHHRHRVFALAQRVGYETDEVERIPTTFCGAKGGGAVLPSPAARDGDHRGEGDAAYWSKRGVERTNGRPLGAGGATLSDFAHALLPTPRGSDGTKGSPNQHGSAGDLLLSSAVQPQHWGRFADAVERHAERYRPPSVPTEPNRNGAPRLAPAFAEWLMCIPAGHVADALPRGAALKAIGNGVCPPQLAQAWRYLIGVDKPNDTSIGSSAMTTTSADVKEIQDRNAAARGRVIGSTMALGVTVDPALIQAAMMELAAVWREEAAHVTAAGRKGHVGIAKEYTMAAARLAGFAVGLTSRPITTADAEKFCRCLQAGHPSPCSKAACESAKDHESLCELCARADDPHPPQCDCGRPACAGLSLSGSGRKTVVGNVETTQVGNSMRTDTWLPGLVAALPAGDPVAATFDPTGGWCAPTNDQLRGICEHPAESKSVLKDGSTKCVACGVIVVTDETEAFINAAMTGDEPVGTQVTVAGIEFTKIGTDPFDISISEEQNLRDIIGPLGASSVTATIDHPFTNPGIPWLNKTRAVDVVPYAQLPIIAAATPPRDHVSHSYVESYEGCSLSAMLRDASRAGHIGASRPGWSMIGGNAFHRAVELIERLALSGVTTADDPEALWAQHFDAVVKEQLDALVGTPYADSATWYISNRSKEGFDWWRVEGAKMVGLYIKHHTPTWRANNPTFLLQDTTPVIELAYTMSIRSLDGERGLTAQGFVDRATLDLATYSLTVLDYKTGSREPESTFQLGEYGHALLMAMGIPDEPADRPILGRYWLARKGIYTDAAPVVTRHPLTELQYRYDAAARGTAAKIFAPHVTNLCKSCSVTDYCPAQAGRP